MDDLQAAQEQERVALTNVQEVQRQIVTARQDIAGMRNRYMELQAECARLMPAITQAEEGLNDLEKHEKDLNLLVTVCRDEQREIVDTMNPFMRGMIELGREMERRNN
jgi:chromosome segregation ATPase